MDGLGGFFAVAHSEDDGGGATDDVAACEDAGERGHKVFVCLDIIPLVEVEARRCFCQQRISACADGDDDEVAVNGEFGAGDWDGTASA